MRSTTLRILLMSVVVAFIAANAVNAVTAKRVPTDKQTTLGLYLTAQEAYDYLRWNATNSLFLDVRDPAEVRYVGMPAGVDFIVPFRLLNLKASDIRTARAESVANTDFVTEVNARVAARGLDKSATLILICSCGRYAPHAVNALTDAGYSNVFTVIDGYRGWKRSNLPWTLEIDPATAYGNPG